MRIYVGNLSWSTGEDELQRAFEAFGKVVSVAVVRDRETDRSRGFGFVEMGSADEGNRAIAEMDGKEVDGRRLRVNEAQPREDRGGGGGGGGSRGGGGGSRGGGGGGGGRY